MTSHRRKTGASRHAEAAELATYYKQLEGVGVFPLWKSMANLVPVRPEPTAVPAHWRYQDVRPQLMRAGELVSAEEAERRVLMLLNPADEIARLGGTTSTLYAGIQLVLPNETARAHHHVAGAFRLIIESNDDAYTTVDGERVFMRPGDLILTPNWRFHDHNNESDQPIIWLDGLDLPLTNFFDANFYELHSDIRQKVTKADNLSSRSYIHGRLNPVGLDNFSLHSPINNYPWVETERALAEAIAAGIGSPTDGVMFEFSNPVTGGAVIPTMNCFVQALRPGQHTQAHRHTPSVVYHSVRGGGTTVIDGEPIDWEEKDVFCIPSWATHEHINTGSEEAVLFSYTNERVYRLLDYYREEVVERQM